MEHEPYQSRFDPATGAPLVSDATLAQNTAQNYDAAAVPPLQQPETKMRPLSTKRDVWLAVLLALLGALLVDTLFYATAGLGMTICLCLLLLVTVWYLWKQRRTVSGYALFCIAGAFALGLSMVFSDDGYLKFLAFVGCVGLMTLLPIELYQLRRRRPGTIYAIGDFCSMLFVRTFGRLGGGCWSLFHKESGNGTPRKRKLGGVLAGIGLAVPAVAIVVPLLMFSDAAFEGLMDRFQPEDLVGHILTVLCGLFLALLLFSQLFSVHSGERNDNQITPSGGKLDPVIAVSFLSALSLVYVLYLVSQAAYFFDGFRGLLPKGYTVAEYARRGFFEMSVVCVLNLGFVFLTLLLTRKQDGKAPLAVRLLALFVCVFSLVLVVTSISKMFLYIHSFGLTRLRVLTSAFMLFLGVVFLAVILWLFVRKVPYVKVAVVAATVIVLALSYANVDRIIASYNVHAYLDGRLEAIDMDTLDELSDAAVPYLIELWDEHKYAAQARAQLRERAYLLFDVKHVADRYELLPKKDDDFRSFNTVEYAAKQLIQSHAAEIFK